MFPESFYKTKQTILFLLILLLARCLDKTPNSTPNREGVPAASHLFEADQNFIGDLEKDGYEIRFFTQVSGDKFSLGFDFYYIYTDENSEEATKHFQILEHEKFPEDMDSEDALYLYNLLYPNHSLSMFF